MNKHITGFPDLVIAKVTLDTGVPKYDIADGDPLAHVNGLAVPSHDWTWDTNIATTRDAFVAAFIGMASGRSRAASEDTRDLTVPCRQDGVDLVDVASASYTLGQYLGPRKNPNSNNLDIVLEGVSAKSHATHVCMETTDGNVTKVKARLINTIPKK